MAARRYGIAVEAWRDDTSQRVITLTRGAFTKTVPVEQLRNALREAREQEAAHAVA